MTAERPDPREAPAASDDQDEAGEADEVYSEDEEAAVAARLEDLGYM